MKKLWLLALVSVFFVNCDSSDNTFYPELEEHDIWLEGIGLDRLKFSGKMYGGWWEYRLKGETTFIKTDFKDGMVYGLEAGKTYELQYVNEKHKTDIKTVTTKAVELDYSKIYKSDCLFEKRAVKTKREYTWFTRDEIVHDKVDMYLINKELNDSVRVSAKIGADKKSFTFTIPDEVFIDSKMPEITYLGFKIGERMDYFFYTFYDKGHYDYEKNKYVPAKIYKDLKHNLGSPFFVENITPRLLAIRASKNSSFSTIRMEGRMFHFIHYGGGRCPEDRIEAIASTLSIYLEDQQTLFLDVALNKGDAKPASKLNTFEVFLDGEMPNYLRDDASLQATALQYYTNILPKGTYYFQYKVLLADRRFLESNKIKFVTEGIEP